MRVKTDRAIALIREGMEIASLIERELRFIAKVLNRSRRTTRAAFLERELPRVSTEQGLAPCFSPKANYHYTLLYANGAYP